MKRLVVLGALLVALVVAVTLLMPGEPAPPGPSAAATEATEPLEESGAQVPAAQSSTPAEVGVRIVRGSLVRHRPEVRRIRRAPRDVSEGQLRAVDRRLDAGEVQIIEPSDSGAGK